MREIINPTETKTFGGPAIENHIAEAANDIFDRMLNDFMDMQPTTITNLIKNDISTHWTFVPNDRF